MLSYFWDSKTARILSTILIFAAVLAFLHGSRETLTLFLSSVLFSCFVEPLVALLDRLLHGRIKAVIVTYLLIGGVLTALVLLLGPLSVDEAKEVTASLPAFPDNRIWAVHPQPSRHQGWKPDRVAQIQQYFINHRNAIFSYGGGFASDLEGLWFAREGIA